MAAPIGRRGSQQFSSQNHTTLPEQFKCQDNFLVSEPGKAFSALLPTPLLPDIGVISSSLVQTFMVQPQKDVPRSLLVTKILVPCDIYSLPSG